MSQGCHEAISTAALRAVRDELPAAAPLPPTPDEQALIDDVQFVPDADMEDLGGITLLLGVRDVDLKGFGSSDLSELASVHGSPGSQREHCLRGENQQEPGGSRATMEDCRNFIRNRVVEALAGLDAAGRPDVLKRTTLRVHLQMRGTVDAVLPLFYVRVGEALHAVQDGFTHNYRTPDSMQVTVALDWLNTIDGALEESRDGPAHASELDRCDDPDALRTRRRQLATEASQALISATLQPGKSDAEKLVLVDAVLDKYLSYSPGCTFANNWCDAPERQYANTEGWGCSVNQRGGRGGALPTVVLAILLAAARRIRLRRSAIASTLLAMAGVTLGAPPKVDAQPVSHSPTLPPGVPPPTTVPVAEPGPSDPSKMAFGLSANAGGSIQKAALAGSVGARLRVSRHWTVGLDGEWNPWFAINGTPFRRGTANVYGTGILRFPLAYQNFNLRITTNLGVSYLMIPLYGVPEGSMGPYVGVSPLGLEWKLSGAFYLIINPLNIALPIPKISGLPFVYPQYRFTLGLEIYAG